MTVRFSCANCRKILKTADSNAGGTFTCPKCGQRGVVPPPQDEAGPTPVAIPLPDAAPETPEEEPEKVRFSVKREEDPGLDMTPMVDMTFLLLIFFMVTAAFALQKSLDVPTPDKQDSATQARTIEELEMDDDYVIIRIDRDNTVWVNDSEAPSPQEVLVKLREAREGEPGTDTKGPSSLLVLADGEARHETVVMALDAGNAVGMENVRLATVDEEDL
ncbi:MAG: biopolymer transporter ExbD [Pirellulales bacterium]|nr:biopolymer transporter ExbD [Pirellulales bacterium]